jgi:hypothetical protein
MKGHTMEALITTKRSELVAAFERWEAEAKAGNWQHRDETHPDFATRHADNADYLIELIEQARG